MKLIYSKTLKITNKATSVTASSANPNYPASNLLLGKVAKVWQSVAAVAPIATKTLNIAVPAGITNALAIFGTNATSIAYAIKDVTEVTTYFSGTIDTTPATPARTWNRAWLEWASNGAALHIILTLTAPTTATYHQAGEIVVGETVGIPDPLYGPTQGRENFQVVQRLAGGGFYVHDGVIVRSFDLSWVMDRETEFDDLDELYECMGQKPIAMLINELANNDCKWCGYFNIIGAPKGRHDFPVDSPVTMSIREAA